MLKILYTDSDKWHDNKNFFYLLWFQPSLGIIVFSKAKIHIFLDGRYIEKQKEIDIKNLKEKLNNNTLEINFIELKKDYKNTLSWIIKRHKKLTLEKTIPYFFYETIKELKPKKEITFKENIFEKQRIIKNDDEIDKIKNAINIIDNVYLEVDKLNKSWKLIWKTELEIRSFIISKIFDFWGEWESFETIIAFWKNSAIPHHKTWKTIIRNGPLLIDMWAVYKWYASDFSRTLWVWEENNYNYQEFKKIYDIVAKAHKKALNISKIWLKTSKIDKKARDIITKNWYAEYFNHSTGHGIWLDVHELPNINSSSDKKLKVWMVFTIEPWIYLPWKFWVRLENIIICTNNWPESYSKIEI